MTYAIYDEDLDSKFIHYSSLCAEPLLWAYSLLRFRLVAPLDPTKFNNCESKVAEVALRTFIAIGGFLSIGSGILPVAAIVLGIAHKVLRAIGFALQKDNYSHWSGSLPEKSIANGNVKVMTWNVCGVGGGMHYDHGGVNDWRLRLDGMVDKIIAEDPDVLVLQEIYDTALAEALKERLGARYAHFFTHLGANIMGSVGGLMVLSKCAVHRFTNTSFDNNDWSLNRTIATLEIKARPEDNHPCARIIGTHLIHDNNPKRIAQVNQIVKSLENVPPLPTVLMGDLNLERDVPAEGGILASYVEHGYLGKEPTRTNQLLKQWDEKLVDPGDFIDYISIFKGHAPNVQLVDTHLVKAYSPDFNTRTALSDHNGLAATLRL